MFTEGLDRHALQWVQQQRTDHLRRRYQGEGGGLGLPPPEKFGRFPRAAHVIPTQSEVGSDSDDFSVDTENEVYESRYSIESSPQNDTLKGKVYSNGGGRFRSGNQYSSEGYSEFSSSRDSVGRRRYKEEEEDDTDFDGSSEFVGRGRGGNAYGAEEAAVNLKVSYRGEGGGGNVKAAVNEDCNSDVPSAPPFHGSHENISQVSDQLPSSEAYSSTCPVGSNGYLAKVDARSQANFRSDIPKQKTGSSLGCEPSTSSCSLPARIPTFHACGLGPWYSVIAYEACIRLCLHSWASGCMEAPLFLENECAVLRNAFGLQQMLLQSEEELLAKQSSELVSEGATVKPKKIIGKLKIQVRKVRMDLDVPSGCNYLPLSVPVVKLESFRSRISNLQSNLSSEWESLRKVRVFPRRPAFTSFSKHSLAYMRASPLYLKQVSKLLKVGVTTLRSSSYETVQESYSCLLRLKSLSDEDSVRMQAGSSETHLFFPDSLGDDLIIEVYDSKGKFHGRVIAQVASIAENPNDKVRWWSIYREPEHELVGHIQLSINYTTSLDENSALKCGPVAETVAYDLVLEVAMKAQNFRQRNLLLHGSWKWLLTEFASYFGVSDTYTKLRYLSYVMDVATPTADCLMLVHSLLSPVILRSYSKTALSHQENRIMGEIKEQVESILAMVFENYKSLDESSPSGMVEAFKPSTGTPAPVLAHAIKLYALLHDVLAPEAQLKLCGYFQAAAKKRSRRHFLETDEFVASSNEGILLDVVTISTAYQKMKTLCTNFRNEIFADIQIHDQHVLPSFVDLPNICSSIYSVDLCNRLRAFLVACPPTGPSAHVAELVIATAGFQKDLASWNICPVKGGVDAKELFHLYIILWIQDKRLTLLESCKLDKVKWSVVRTQHLTTPFVDDMYDQLKETLKEYEVIISRWPEYTFVLENAIADVEKAIIEALEKQYADVLGPLKDSMAPKKFGLKYVQKLAKRSSLYPYTVPDELGVLLNTMKRLLDVLWPKIETQFKSWGCYMPDGGNTVGERLNEVTVPLRAKFRNYMQAVVEKLAENTRAQNATKLKQIIKDSKGVVVESEIRNRMQPLNDQLVQSVNHLHTVFEVHVFVAICRGFWDRMGQDVLSFLENHKENRSLYKGSRVTLTVLDDTFASQMQQLLGNSVTVEDLMPPRSVVEARSVLCRDATIYKESNFYY